MNKGAQQGRPFTYTEEMFIIFFMLMQFRQIHAFKAQWRWLTKHPGVPEMLGWETAPHRTTISRRYKALYEVVQEFVLFIFISQYASDLDEQFTQRHLVEDKNLFKALGPARRQSGRKEGRIPDKLRNLDTDATWSKSAYHGWVYGYTVYITCNEEACPAMVQVETAAERVASSASTSGVSFPRSTWQKGASCRGRGSAAVTGIVERSIGSVQPWRVPSA